MKAFVLSKMFSEAVSSLLGGAAETDPSVSQSLPLLFVLLLWKNLGRNSWRTRRLLFSHSLVMDQGEEGWEKKKTPFVRTTERKKRGLAKMIFHFSSCFTGSTLCSWPTLTSRLFPGTGGKNKDFSLSLSTAGEIIMNCEFMHECAGFFLLCPRCLHFKRSAGTVEIR